jgi:HK97 family phage major capsid protein
MAFNQWISRADAAALIPEEVSNAILSAVTGGNPLLQLARRLPDMNRQQLRMPVQASLATAFFLQGDTDLKRTTQLQWENRFIDAAEVAAIVPIPEMVLADVNYDIWGMVMPELIMAFNVAITEAVLYGINIPASWTVNMGGNAGLLAFCVAAGHNPSLAAFPDIYDAILSETVAGAADGLYMTVENDGYDVTGVIAAVQQRGTLRGLRDLTGQPIFKAIYNEGVQGPTRYELDGRPMYFPNDGTMNPAASLMFAGQWDQLLYAVRQDMSFKLLTEAVIQDGAGNIVFNLAQQDMVALRAVLRIGFALPNPINRMNQVAATRSAFSVLTP